MATTNIIDLNHARPDLKVVDVTPELAAEWLALMPSNRRLRVEERDRYAREMEQRNWFFDGTPIKFNYRGELIDGQHRLSAIVKSGLTVRMVVATGLELEVADSLDTGVKRTAADVLKLHGYKNTNVLAGAARWLMNFERTAGQFRSPDNSAVRYANSEILAYVRAHEGELLDGLAAGEALRHHVGGAGAMLCGGFVVFSRIDVDDARFFYDRLADGVGLVETDAVYRLRKVFLDQLSARGTGRTLAPGLMWAYMAKAWNFYRQGTPVKLLGVKMGGASREQVQVPA